MHLKMQRLSFVFFQVCVKLFEVALLVLYDLIAVGFKEIGEDCEVF